MHNTNVQVAQLEVVSIQNNTLQQELTETVYISQQNITNALQLICEKLEETNNRLETLERYVNFNRTSTTLAADH